MATAHLIHGYIGAGKTTLARRLEQDLPAIRFTHDEWMSTLYGADPPLDSFADRFERVTALIERLWPRCLELGADVVLDLGFWSRAQRDAARRVVARVGAGHRLYRVACPEEAAWSRIARRNSALGSDLFIARPTFDGLKARFEPLADDEDRTEIAT